MFLDGQVASASVGLAFITCDDEHHRVAIFENPDDHHDPGTNTVGLAHFAFSCASLGDLIAHYEHMKEIGVMPMRVVNDGPNTSLYYRDPYSNALEAQFDNFPSVGALKRIGGKYPTLLCPIEGGALLRLNVLFLPVSQCVKFRALASEV